jgi:hypothetical protein
MHFEGFACASQRLIPLLNAQPTGEEAGPGQNRTLLSGAGHPFSEMSGLSGRQTGANEY